MRRSIVRPLVNLSKHTRQRAPSTTRTTSSRCAARSSYRSGLSDSGAGAQRRAPRAGPVFNANSAQPTFNDVEGTHGSLNVDASASLKITENVSLTLEARQPDRRIYRSIYRQRRRPAQRLSPHRPAILFRRPLQVLIGGPRGVREGDARELSRRAGDVGRSWRAVPAWRDPPAPLFAAGIARVGSLDPYADMQLGPRLRGPAQGGPRQRHLPQPDLRGRPSRSDHPQGWRRLLHDLLDASIPIPASSSGTAATW